MSLGGEFCCWAESFVENHNRGETSEFCRKNLRALNGQHGGGGRLRLLSARHQVCNCRLSADGTRAVCQGNLPSSRLVSNKWGLRAILQPLQFLIMCSLALCSDFLYVGSVFLIYFGNFECSCDPRLTA